MKKLFFKQQSLGTIKKKYNFVRDNKNYINNLLSLKEFEAFIFEDFDLDSFNNSKSYLKKSNRLIISEMELLAKSKILPFEARKEKFDNVSHSNYGAYSYISKNSFVPDIEISLVNCLEGAKLFNYSNQDIKGCCKPFIKLTQFNNYTNNNGSTFIFKVPSRTKNRKKYGPNKYDFIPFEDNSFKFFLSYLQKTDHSCDEKVFDIRKSKISKNKIFRNFCPHEIASYFEYINNVKLTSQIPLEGCLFAIPTQLAVDVYNLAMNRSLVYKNDNLRNLNKAELEKVMWTLVKDYGHDATFFARKKIKEYNWNYNNIITRL